MLMNNEKLDELESGSLYNWLWLRKDGGQQLMAGYQTIHSETHSRH